MKAPLEAKVAAATGGSAIGTALAGFVIWLLDAYMFKTDPIPDPVVVLVWVVIPAGVAFLAGRLAPHTARIDPAVRKQYEKKGFALVPSEPTNKNADDIEPDPRTDGVGDGGENELPPLNEKEIATGVRHEKVHRAAALKQLGEDE